MRCKIFIQKKRIERIHILIYYLHNNLEIKIILHLCTLSRKQLSFPGGFLLTLLSVIDKFFICYLLLFYYYNINNQRFI